MYVRIHYYQSHINKYIHTHTHTHTHTGDEWEIEAKVVVNATGVFADKVRQMDDPEAIELIEPAAGVCVCVCVCVCVRVCVCVHVCGDEVRKMTG